MYATTNSTLLTQYKNDSVMTAGPIELVIMLYDGLIKNIKLAGIFIEDKSFEKVNLYLGKGQEIVLELIRILDLRYEISEQLMQLYDFMLSELAKINATKDASRIPDLLSIITELRDTWQTVQAQSAHLFVADED